MNNTSLDITPPKPAVAYLRVSSKGQLDGDGFPRQRAAIESFAAARGYTITKWFEEQGLSGETEWENRPAWSEMLAFLNGTRTIIIERFDRLARNLLVQELILRDLRLRDVYLLTTTGEDTSEDDPTRVMFRQILGAFSAYEKASLVLKLRSARQRSKDEHGRCEGRKPFGHHPGESVVLGRMLELRRDGESAEAIAGCLNRDGVRPRYGEMWRGQTVRKILGRVV